LQKHHSGFCTLYFTPIVLGIGQICWCSWTCLKETSVVKCTKLLALAHRVWTTPFSYIHITAPNFTITKTGSYANPCYLCSLSCAIKISLNLLAQNDDEMDIWGQLHQHAYQQLLHAQILWWSILFHQQYYAELYQYIQLQVLSNFYATYTLYSVCH